ncbi:hypothetical protein [Runella sp. SP2]|uniref:hypothetical protein n=1 Tax=Runella sp. SP2 TaxID=2268026 RepID=UPI000F08ABA7|nr:hypothetical protein [Runella sp. SP2]AYQ31419.1 hypothetical protein DTQ70_04145 [Runella sp. SP2]
MSKISAFEILSKMSDANMAIALSDTLVEGRKVKQGAVLGIGVSEEWYDKVLVLGYPTKLLIFDPDQYKQMEAMQNSSEERDFFGRTDMIDFARWYSENKIDSISDNTLLVMYLDSPKES